MKKRNKKVPLRLKVYLALAIITAIIFIILGGISTAHTANNAMRLGRIKQIYANLHLGSEYQMTVHNVFGQKRPYDWGGGGRSYSSQESFVVGKTRDDAVADVRKAIEAEGFVYFDEPYAGSVFTELHFKSTKGEYIRLNVSSKSRDDAYRNALIMKQDLNALKDVDPNAGPANVTIKVNLDDNNE